VQIDGRATQEDSGGIQCARQLGESSLPQFAMKLDRLAQIAAQLRSPRIEHGDATAFRRNSLGGLVDQPGQREGDNLYCRLK
jgi:hypothetical protein